MTKSELTELMIGENLDTLMNLDPRGYGVCRILYAGSRAYTGEPLSMHGAKMLLKYIKPGDFVFILCGFVLLPHKVPEMDGMISSMLLARSLVLACDAKPVIICPGDCVEAVIKCSNVVGLHIYESMTELAQMPLSMGVIAFTKDSREAENQTKEILDERMPGFVISIEAPGPNQYGEFHNAVGKNVTALEAKSYVLFRECQKRGVPTLSIGDLGNEIGMGTIAEHIQKYVPYADEHQCQCGCGGGILADSTADAIITATVSDWGCYGLMAAMAFLKKNLDIFHKGDMESEVMQTAARHGLIDMTGSLIPGIDGFNMRMNVNIVDLMRQCVGYPVKFEGNSDQWFEKVIEKEFYEAV